MNKVGNLVSIQVEFPRSKFLFDIHTRNKQNKKERKKPQLINNCKYRLAYRSFPRR